MDEGALIAAAAVVFAAAAVGYLIGRSQRHRSERLREPLTILQAALLGLVGLILATPLLAGVLVSLVLVVTFDLDRPTRGLIRVPDKPLVDLRASMEEPPAAVAPADP